MKKMRKERLKKIGYKEMPKVELKSQNNDQDSTDIYDVLINSASHPLGAEFSYRSYDSGPSDFRLKTSTAANSNSN